MKKLILITFILIIAGFNQVFADTTSTDAKLYYNQGVDYYKNGLYEQSMDSFRQAITADPNYIDAYYNLGMILEYTKQDTAALSMFKQIIIRNPEDYDSVYKAAEISNRLGYTDEAKSYLALIPINALAYKKASELATLMGTNMQTIKAAQKAKVARELGSNTTSETTTTTTTTTTTKPSIPQTNGSYSHINSPTGITTDSLGNVYIASFADNAIYKYAPSGQKTVKVKDARVSGPIGLAIDNYGYLYIANYNKNNVLKVSNSGQISVLLANISKPYVIYIKGNMLFVSSQGTNSVIRYKIH